MIREKPTKSVMLAVTIPEALMKQLKAGAKRDGFGGWGYFSPYVADLLRAGLAQREAELGPEKPHR